MNTTIARVAAPAAGVLIVGASVLTGTAVSAQAATAAPPAQPVAAQTATKAPVKAAPGKTASKTPAPAAKKAPQPRYAHANRYVTNRQIARYRITPLQMKQIVAAQKFANRGKARMIRARESRGNYRIVSSNGRYFGAYQFDRQTWLRMGGGKFAPTANRAPAWAQNYIMWKTVRSHGWAPWGG